MTPVPTALGLFICEQIIVDQHSRNPSLISIYTGRGFLGFPTDRVPFSVFCSLTDARGKGTIRLVVERLLRDQERPERGPPIYEREGAFTCHDRRAIVNTMFRVHDLAFPEPGTYQFAVFVDGDSVASRELRVYEMEP